ncbi:MAG: hypothetical protein LBO03_08925 [Acidaminococcales bacterium]|jgi:hypothetical protein|nr:hypothetical protein [Acidaminococcales bacterium]
MRKLGKMPRKMKTLALGAGIASLFLGVPPARAADYTYDGASSGPGYIDLAPVTGSEWFYTTYSNYPHPDGAFPIGSQGIWNPSGASDGNRLTIDFGSNTALAPHFVFGGITSDVLSNAVRGNEVNYISGDGTGGIIGGFVQHGIAEGNTVNYRGGNISGIVTYETPGGDDGEKIGIFGGAVSESGGTVNGNVVNIALDDGADYTIGGNVAGGAMILASGDVGASVVGSGNAVAIVNTGAGHLTFAGTVVGGWFRSTSGTSQGNRISIVNKGGGSISTDGDVYANYAYAGTTVGGGDDRRPDIYLENVAIGSRVAGGEIDMSGTATDHRVVIIGGRVASIVYGSWIGYNGTVTGNKVTIKNSEIVGNVYGGYVGSSGEASNNEVLIDGGSVGGDIAGGYVRSGTANNNTVTLAGAIAFGGGSLRGYESSGGTGNALRLYSLDQDGAFATVERFDTYEFKVIRGDAFALEANTVDFGAAVVLPGIEITGSGKLNVGDEVGLIKAASTFSDAGQYDGGVPMDGSQGIFVLYDFNVKKRSSNELVAEVASARANPKAKAVSEGWLAGPAFLNQGADLLAGEGFREAAARAWAEKGPAVFAALSYSDVRHDTGSHVDVKGPSLVAGLSFAKETGSGAHLTYGAFLEAGWGSYDSYNNFGGADEARGNGDTTYRGLGFLARRENAKRGSGRFYAEGSLRLGQVKTNFNSADLKISGQNARYDAKSVYCGLHVGAGWIKELKGGGSLDLYSKILYTRTGSESTAVLGNDPLEFDAVNSLRWRAGLRYAKASGEKKEFYAGLAYDHEFDGKAKAVGNGMAIDAPGMKGGTGIGEIGVIFKGKNSLVNLKAEGYAGKRKGVGFAAQFKWFF